MKLTPTCSANARLWLGFTLSLALGSADTTAQAQENEDSPVFDFGPFVVETDSQSGYVQTNSNSGTRLNQAIKDLPIPVEIITGEFIEDIGALDIKEALQFSAGLETQITSQQIGENTSNPNAFRLRGFVSEAVMRSGFRVIGATDNVNVSQVDVVRGPNALLYGIGNFGGVVNYVTTRPTNEFRGKMGVTFGSWNFVRVQAQASGPVGKSNGYSIGVFRQQGDNWYENNERKKEGFSGLWELRIGNKTSITFEAEYIVQRSTNPEDPISGSFLGSVTDGLDIIDPTHFPQTLLDFDGTDIYENPDSRRGFVRYPYPEFRYGGLDTWNETRDSTFTINLIHNFSKDLSLQVGVNQVRRDRNSQALSLSYASMGGILQDTPEGERLREAYPWMWLPQHPQYDAWHTDSFRALAYNWSRDENVEVRNQARAEVVWTKEILNVRNTIVAGTTYVGFHPNQGATFGLKDRARDPASPTRTDLSGLRAAYDRYQAIQNYEPIRLQLSDTEEWVVTRGYRPASKFWERGYYLIHQGKFWKDRINTVAGVRYDWIHTSNPIYWETDDEGYTNDLLGEIRTFRHRADGPSTDLNTSIGVSYAPNDAFSIFILRASALQPIYNQVDARGIIPDPVKGISKEIGVKFDLWDTKVSGAASFYEIERDGVVLANSFGNTTYDRSDANDPNADPDWVAQGRGLSRDLGLKQDLSRGVDLQVFITNIVQGLQTVVNFSYNYYEWQRFYGPSYVRKEGTGEDAVFIFEELDRSNTINPFRKYNDTPEFSFRLWTKYVFGEGPMKGLSLGLGFNWTDEREATIDPNTARETLKIIPARTEWSAAVSYSGKLKDLDWSMQLNVYNLLDDDGVAGYSFLNPRNFRLSMNLTF